MYCPKCDMEFREGVTVCTDCGSPLVDKEAWFAAEEERAAAEEKEAEEKAEEETYTVINGENGGEEIEITKEDLEELLARRQAYQDMMEEPAVFVESKAKYNDNKSVAVAFIVVGALMSIFAVGLWSGKIRLGILFNLLITVFAVGSFVMAFVSLRTANRMKGDVEKEENRRKDIFDSFLAQYDSAAIDEKITGKDLGPEEEALARLDIIQDILMNTNDIADKTFAAAIAEDIYAKLYES